MKILIYYKFTFYLLLGCLLFSNKVYSYEYNSWLSNEINIDSSVLEKPKKLLNLKVCEDKKSVLNPEMIFTNFNSAAECAEVLFENSVPNFGYSTSTYWLLLKIKSIIDMPLAYLEIAFPPLQNIELYYLKDGKIISSLTGKIHPIETRPILNRNYIFPIYLKNQSENVFIVKVKTAGSVQLPINLYHPNTLAVKLQKDAILYGVYFGLILIMALYNFAIFIFLKRDVYIYYVLYTLSIAALQATLSGNAIVWLWPNFIQWNKISTVYLVGQVFFLLSVFIIKFLNIKMNTLTNRLLFIPFWIYCFILSIGSFYFYGPILVKLTGVMGFVGPIFLLIISIFFKNPKKSYLFTIFALSSFLIGAQLYSLKDLGVLSSNFITENGILIGSSLEIVLFSLGLGYQFKELSEANLSFQLNIQKQKNKMILMEANQAKTNMEIEKVNYINAISKQVAHDIRSPLSALNSITNSLTDVAEEKRFLIKNAVQRINDISNDLLQKGKATYADDALKIFRTANYNFLLATVVDNIVSEKRIQFREKINVHINVDFKNSFGLFVKANPNELSRVISNLINNSVEALPSQSGDVDVSVFAGADNKACIQIKDNGTGIPKHILEKFGQTGITHGKENTQSGSGLGVYHAMKTIQEFGGKIIFQSITSDDMGNYLNTETKKNTGTSIIIELPTAETPHWFADVINLKPGQELVTVDDDISIHQIWKGRLESLKSKERNIKITSFTSAKEFREYFNKKLNSILNTYSKSVDVNLNINSNSAVVFLIDYEFLSQNDNGLKIITELGIQEKAILVTSRFDEPCIRSECEAQKIRILPKQLAGQIPIIIQLKDPIVTPIVDTQVVSDIQSDQMKLTKYDLCLIDDDKILIHAIWGMAANEKGLNIKMFERPEDFFIEASSIDKSTPIFVDVSLGQNINGIEVANTIHEHGFENINLATGYESESIKAPNFIRQVVGKDFPSIEF